MVSKRSLNGVFGISHICVCTVALTVGIDASSLFIDFFFAYTMMANGIPTSIANQNHIYPIMIAIWMRLMWILERAWRIFSYTHITVRNRSVSFSGDSTSCINTGLTPSENHF